MNKRRRVLVQGRFWKTGLVAMVLVLMSCGALGPGPDGKVALETARPAEQSPTAVPTEAPATATPSPTEAPPTATPSPTDVRPTATPSPTDVPPTATPSPTTAPSPVPTESARLQAVTSAEDVQRVDAAAARELVETGQGMLYDTRSTNSYASLHAAGAVSFAESEAAGRLGELPTDRALIFY
jgi:hypothetical protein